MEANTSVFTITTRVDDQSNPTVTTVTVDWAGLTLELCKANFFTSTSPRVGLQSRLRRMGTIPTRLEVKAVDLIGKSRSAHMTQDEIFAAAIQAAKADPTKRIEMLRQLRALEAAAETKK